MNKIQDYDSASELQDGEPEESNTDIKSLQETNLNDQV
jgi:hypothetical protein